MSRVAAAWFWSERKGYYAVIRGRRVLLLKGPEGRAREAEANRVLARMTADLDDGGAPRAGKLGLHALADLFLDRVLREKAESTYRWYKGHLDGFAGSAGDIPSGELRPKHVDRWIAESGAGWNASTRRGAITAVKAMASWAAKRGYLDANPLKELERPRMGRREAVPPELVGPIMASAGDEAFADLLAAIFESGCRPDEVYRVEARHFDPAAGTWRLRGKTTEATGKDRVVYLTPKLAALSAKLAARNPEGPLFRNSEGNPWNRNSVRCRFRRRRGALGKVQAYGLRHLYGTDALVSKGLPAAVVAELMGHSDLKMLSEHYSHVDERAAALRDGAAAVRPAGAGDAGAAGGEAPG